LGRLPRPACHLVAATLGIALALARPESGAAEPQSIQEKLDRHDEKSKPQVPGRWRKVRDAPELTEEQRAQLDELAAIGYLGGVVPESRSGVVAYSAEAAWDGVNIYTSGHGPSALLMDMDGTVLHEWTYSYERAFPGAEPCPGDLCDSWRKTTLLPNGDLIAIFEGAGIIRVDRESELIWARDLAAHHDQEVLSDGRILVLTREPRLIPEIHETFFTLEDFISVLDEHGAELERHSIYDAILRSPWTDILPEPSTSAGDLLHTNTLHRLDGSIEERVPAFRAGNLLISLNKRGALAVWDADTRALSWIYRGPRHGQHDPQILPNGNLLYFDNRRGEAASRIVELDPATEEIVWTYEGSEAAPFYSATCGTVQRLPNGNTLIAESDRGRAFEVDSDRRIVWEFYNPERAGEGGEFIATIFDLQRIPWDDVDDWLPE